MPGTFAKPMGRTGAEPYEPNGVANTLVISVLERRAEIGLRRSLGATREHIRIQFPTKSLLLSLLGGGTGDIARIGRDSDTHTE